MNKIPKIISGFNIIIFTFYLETHFIFMIYHI